MLLSSCTSSRVAVLGSSDYEWILPKGTVLTRPLNSEIVRNGAVQEVIIEMDGIAIAYPKLRKLKQLEGR